MTHAPQSFNRPVHGARGLFSAFVFVFHVVNSGLATWPVFTTPPAQFLLRSTEYGVELFFCISGFVIAGTLRRAAGPLAFLEDRAVRIYPALWASLIAIVVAGLVTGMHGFGEVSGAALAWRLPVNMLALPGLLPIDNLHPAAWSLSYEMGFYLACTTLWVLRERAPRWTMWIAAALCLLALLSFPRAIFFLGGLAIAEGFVRGRVVGRLTRYPLLWLLTFLVAWEGVQALTHPLHIIKTTMFDWDAPRLALAAVALAAATLAFAGIARGHGGLSALLRTPILQYLGTVSYSFYLWHPIVMSGCKAVLARAGAFEAAGLASQLLFFVVALPPSLLVAHVSQVVLERRAGLWLRRRLHHRPPLATPAAV